MMNCPVKQHPAQILLTKTRAMTAAVKVTPLNRNNPEKIRKREPFVETLQAYEGIGTYYTSL
jgi:hypothetical protein